LCNGRFRALHRGPRATAQVVDAAVANADRYYRLVAMGMASRSGDAEWEAALFKAAAAAWLAEKKANSRLNALLQIFEARGRARAVLPRVGCVYMCFHLEAGPHPCALQRCSERSAQLRSCARFVKHALSG